MAEEEEQYESILDMYTIKMKSSDPAKQQSESIVALADYIDYIDESLESEKQKSAALRPVEPSGYDDKAYMYLFILGYFCKEADQKLLQQYIEYSQETQKIARLLIKRLKKSKQIDVNTEKFIIDMKSRISKNKKLNTLRFYKNSLKAKIDSTISTCQLPLLVADVKSNLSAAFYKYDDQDKYVNYPPLDKSLSIYLHHSQFTNMLYPIFRVIADGQVKPALIALAELTELILVDIMNVEFVGRLVLYVSLVRVIFEESYTIYPELNRFSKANGEFLKRCHNFAEQTIGDISEMLPDSISKNYTKGMLVKTMFKRKTVNLMQDMEYMYSPIDLILHIYKACNHLKSYFSKSAAILSEKHLNVLLLVLISVAPPSNAVSIARFIHHWQDFSTKPEAKPFVANFIGAVELLYNFTETMDEEQGQQH